MLIKKSFLLGNPMNSYVDAIIVTYKPSDSLIDTLNKLHFQVRHIYIIDNTADKIVKKKIN